MKAIFGIGFIVLCTEYISLHNFWKSCLSRTFSSFMTAIIISSMMSVECFGKQTISYEIGFLFWYNSIKFPVGSWIKKYIPPLRPAFGCTTIVHHFFCNSKKVVWISSVLKQICFVPWTCKSSFTFFLYSGNSVASLKQKSSIRNDQLFKKANCHSFGISNICSTWNQNISQYQAIDSSRFPTDKAMWWSE